VKKLLSRLAVAGAVIVALVACAIPTGRFTVVKHDYRGHVIHCTYAKYWHPNFPLDGRGYFEHVLVTGPAACGGG
jgi:hypothetical protein